MALPVSGVLKLTDIIAEVGEGSSLATAIAASGESFDRQSDFYGYSSAPSLVINNAHASVGEEDGRIISFYYLPISTSLGQPALYGFKEEHFADAQLLVYGNDTATRDKFKMIWKGELLQPTPDSVGHAARAEMYTTPSTGEHVFECLINTTARRVDNNNLSAPTGWQGDIRRFKMGDMDLTNINYWPPEVCLPAGPGYPAGYYLDLEADLSVLAGGNWYGMVYAGSDSGGGDNIVILGHDSTQVPQDRLTVTEGLETGDPLPISMDADFEWTSVAPGIADTDVSDDAYDMYQRMLDFSAALQAKL
jgi:hypothetical protein